MNINRIKQNKNEMDYMNGKIYQILNIINNEIYVGSTCQSLSKRFYDHKKKCKSCHYKLYAAMREIGKDNFYIELIEEYPCNNKEELRAREGHYIRERATLNHLVAGRTIKQWREHHKERLQEQEKLYKEQHKDHIQEMNKRTIECNLCGISTRRHMIARHQKTNKCKNKADILAQTVIYNKVDDDKNLV